MSDAEVVERDSRTEQEEELLHDIDQRAAHLKHACDAIQNECQSNLAGTTDVSARRLAKFQADVLKESADLSKQVTTVLLHGSEPLYPGDES